MLLSKAAAHIGLIVRDSELIQKSKMDGGGLGYEDFRFPV